MKLKKLLLSALLAVSVNSFSQYNYGEALQKSILFYETQQSGVLPEWNRISWRGDSGINDGQDVGLDLTGGWHDAGDHIKFGFPMAFSATALNWGFLEYQEGYELANQTEHFKQNIKWVTDYFIKCHPSANEFYAQVSFKGQDHSFWMPSEMVDVHPLYGQRESFKLDVNNPGSEVACETAAALASASIIFKDSDPAYSATLLSHARELYEFGDTYRGVYNEDGGIPATGTYSSGGYQDELTWGALWLYKATGEEAYLEKAEAEYTEPDYLWSFVWDDKRYGNMVLLAQITGAQNYKDNVERHLQFWMDNGQGISYSPGGQAHLTQWGSLRHSMNAGLTALIYSDTVETPNQQEYHDFAVSQIEYALGDNPNERSLVTGFGVNPPTQPHHRGQHSSWLRSETIPAESRHTLWGALMGGPEAADDAFVENRSNFQANEVATDYNACYQGVLARMVMEFGGEPLENFPQVEEAGAEFLNEVKIGQNNNTSTQANIWLNNRSGWPARVPSTLKARYFIDISEGLEAGYTVEDYQISVFSTNGSANGGLQAWDADTNIYYVEVEVNEDSMPFPGGQGEYRTEIQLRIELPSTAPAGAWDASNDFSFQGLTDEIAISDYVPIYADGILVGGQEPNGGDTPTALFTYDSDPESAIAPVEVSFDGSGSSDPNGDSLTYSWDFGNGESSTLVNPTITYDIPETYEVSLTVTDVDGNTSTPYKQEIVVEDGNIAPVAVLEATPDAGIAPVTISFDASDSSDENGDDLTYSWDFGDGTSGEGITVDHEYTEINEYLVTLTVSDGSKEDVETTTIVVTDGSPVAVISTDVASGVLPLAVSFDASESVDPTEEGLSYDWDFGNGDTASTETASVTYNEIGIYTVTLTVTNTAGDVDTETTTISVTDGSQSCTFDTPRASALPSVNTSYENIYVLGENGPNLDNITIFTINWDLNNNGLYQFSINTNNGDPDWYNDLREKASYNFNAENPQVTFSGTGIAGLDGVYNVTTDGGNFVMVSSTGGFTLYFSTSSEAPACGVVTTTPTNTAPEADLIGTPNSGTEPLSVTFDASGSTDADGDSLSYAIDYGDGDSGTGAITTHVYDAGTYTATVSVSDGSVVDTSSVLIIVDEDITITPNVDCYFGAPLSTPLETVNTYYENIHVLGTGGPDVSVIKKFTLNWDLNNNGLYQFSFDLNVEPWYTDFSTNSQSFNASSPAITLTGTDIAGLDGTYYATLDNDNFVLVADTYSIYFSNSEIAPDCGIADTSAKNVTSLVNYNVELSPNPTSSIAKVSLSANNIELNNSSAEKTFVLTNVFGESIDSKTTSKTSEVEFDVNNLPAGVYLISVFYKGQKVRVEKLIVN